jgi:hypothetical protein
MDLAQDSARGRLALIELTERDGRLARVVEVRAWPLTLGRAFDNDLVIDDPHVAPQHATLALDEAGALQLRVGQTINGLTLDGRHLDAGEQATLAAGGALLQFGGLRLRLRRPAEVLEPERPLPSLRQATWLVAGAAAAFMMAAVLAEQWVGLDPGADATAWLPLMLGLPGVIAAWAGLWALASKIFQHRFDFGGHLRIVLPWLAAVTLVDLTVQPLGAALGWPALWRMAPVLQALMGVLLLRAHLLHVLPGSRRLVSTLAAAAALAGMAISVTLTMRATDRFSRPAYMSSLPMPGLRLDAAVPSAQLVQDIAPLAEQLAQRVRKAKADDDGEADLMSD